MSVDQSPPGRSWRIWLGASVALALSVLGLVGLSGKEAGPAQPALLLDAVNASDRIKGSASARVVLVEYGDYQCPACAAFDPFVSRLSEEFGDNLAVAYRHFPLRQIHPNADPAARAAEAAARQGKFWEMHHLLYGKQKFWKDGRGAEAKFADYAGSLGLNVDAFKRDMADPAIKAKIERDFQSGLAAGVNGTPTFFLNGVRIEPQNYEQFRAMVAAVIQTSDVRP